MNALRLPSAAPLRDAFRFYGKWGLVLTFFMLFSAVGRAIQMGAAGRPSSTAGGWLELLVESARLITVLIILGEGSFLSGIRRLGKWLRCDRYQWKLVGKVVRTNLRFRWKVPVWNLMLFALLAGLTNGVLSWATGRPEVIQSLKDVGLLHGTATGVPILFFLKNLTVIPFTVVFEYCLGVWLTGNLSFPESNVPKDFRKPIKPLSPKEV